MSMRHGAHSSESDIISSELFLERALSSGGRRWSVDPGVTEQMVVAVVRPLRNQVAKELPPLFIFLQWGSFPHHRHHKKQQSRPL